MNLKDILKSFKLNESTISMLLGAVVVAVVGILLVNYVREKGTQPQILPDAGRTELTQSDETLQDKILVNQTYVVSEGDSLWSIAERAYGSGEAWKVIADANNIKSSRYIRAGQELTIPQTDKAGRQLAQSDNLQAQIAVSPIPTLLPVNTIATDSPTLATVTPTEKPILTPTPIGTPLPTITPVTETVQTIQGDKYTVQKGDTLWEIAQRAYGDPYKWTEIAKANNLNNPNLIHRGNEFVIPR